MTESNRRYPLHSSIPASYSTAIICITTILFLILTGCSTLPLKKPQAPIVSVADVRPLNLSFSKQRLAFSLNVQNPNPYDLPLERLDFVASFAGQEIATGESNETVTLPANGNAIVEVEVVAAVNKFLSNLQSMLNAGSIDLNYGVKGHVKLANWPTRIPFDVEGELEPPEKL